MTTPIVLFVYNRPEHTQKTIEALKNNHLADKSELFIFSDGPKNQLHEAKVQKVRSYLKSIKSFKRVTIIDQDENLGLANSVIHGVSEVIGIYEKAIVLEDDLISSPNMLTYMNKALEVYEGRSDIFSISGYNHSSAVMPIPSSYKQDVYLSYRPSSWGWASWKGAWEKADWEMKDYDLFSKSKQRQREFSRGGDDMLEMLQHQMDGKIDSWAIRWCYAHYKEQAYAVYPVYSCINNIGFDGSGVHCNDDGLPLSELSKAKVLPDFPSDIAMNEEIARAFQKVYAHSSTQKIKNRIKKLIRYENWRS